MESESLRRALHREILLARQRVYEIAQPTPLEAIELSDPSLTLFVKREDLSPIHAYKWRGAYNRMAQLSLAERKRGVVTASAGNHAQGVALAARKLGTCAIIFMPLSTPRMKQLAVKQHGRDHVEIRLVGDTYDAASAAAHTCASNCGQTYIHAYDDLAVMAGQGTLADEIVTSGQGPFDFAFLQVGGGGMAAATAAWLKMHFPKIHIVGVEGVDQASMAAAVTAGEPVTLDQVDVFCDGTAVRRAGRLTHQLCAEVIDEWMTVTNDEVSAAIQFHWEHLRCIPEPSGAMGVAAALKRRAELKGKRVLTILCGANMDFEQLATIARRSAVGASRRHYLRIGIKETAGAMYRLLETLPHTVNIADFQYGKIDTVEAHPVIGFDLAPMEFEILTRALHRGGFEFTDVTTDPDVAFRLIPYQPQLMRQPFFMTLEFHERTGALADFLRVVSPHASLCYFNYIYSGERVGRALLAFEFDAPADNANFERLLNSAPHAYRAYQRVPTEIAQRILG